MRILIAGNSQSGCLKLALDQNPSVSKGHEVHFHVFPGGAGPNFDIVDGMIRTPPWALDLKFPPKCFPASVSASPISEYDCIVVSALGYMDGGFLYKQKMLTSGLLYCFSPKENELVSLLISEACARAIITSNLLDQPGFCFLQQLASNFDGQIFVQPFPRVSSSIKERSDWLMNQLYNEPLKAYEFFCEARDEVLAKACTAAGATCLEYPPLISPGALFTPAEFMLAADGLHPTSDYGLEVLRQIVNSAERQSTGSISSP